MWHKANRSPRTLAGECTRLTDRLAGATLKGDKRLIRNAEKALATFQNKLTAVERQRLLGYFNKHEPAESATAILLGS